MKEREPGRQLSHSPRHLRFWTRRVKRSSTQGEFFQACSSCLGSNPKLQGGWCKDRTTSPSGIWSPTCKVGEGSASISGTSVYRGSKGVGG